MPRRTPLLAKLTRPRLGRAVARERLFTLLDDARKTQSAVCVVSPPGAGKTTLVANWLDERSIKGIWYQVDPGDTDLATFFHYLAQAIIPFSRNGQRPLPALTPEYLPDVPGFARRFFRELFSRLPLGAALVLDNYQEVPVHALFHRVVADAVTEIPPGMFVVLVSRAEPSEHYARLIANERLVRVRWDDLRLTFDEANALAQARGLRDQQQIRLLHS
jgi:ATP/maltotriose-dependent transcriptional regulator MalT